MGLSEDHNCPLLTLFPDEILYLVMQHLDFIDCHRVSAVCRSWRSTFKNNSSIRNLLTPKDEYPCLISRKYDTSFSFYRPLFNTTYSIDLPELYITNCLFSKDGWLLQVDYEQKGYYNLYGLILTNLFTMDKVNLPELKIGNNDSSIYVNKGAFSTLGRSPNCVILAVAYEDDELGWKSAICVWKEGEHMWYEKEYTQLDSRIINVYKIWICGDQIYLFTQDQLCFALDTLLNLKGDSILTTPVYTSSAAVCQNELFGFGVDKMHKFDRSIMDWVIVDGGDMIWFPTDSSCNSTTIIERNSCIKEQLLSALGEHGWDIEYRGALAYAKLMDPYPSSYWVNVG